jgi:uncharacterized protein YjdB
MADLVTLNSDMVVYNQLSQTAYLERIQDVLDVFNAASQGAIILQSEAVEGDYSKEAFYKIGGSAAHRDVNSKATVERSKIGSDEMVGVKCPWKYGPYASTEEAFKRRNRSVDEFSILVGQDAADATMAYMVEAAFASLEAAIGANASMTTTASWATHGKKVLTRGMRLFGDRFNRIAMFGMDASTYFDLVDDAIDDKIYEEAGLIVYGGTPGTLGKPVLVTDKAPADTILGLQPGAVTIKESQAPGFRFYPINDEENLEVGFRSEGTFNVELLGYSWDVGGSAPANPNKTQLGTGANWTKHATSDKATAGVLIDLSGS